MLQSVDHIKNYLHDSNAMSDKKLKKKEGNIKEDFR